MTRPVHFMPGDTPEEVVKFFAALASSGTRLSGRQLVGSAETEALVERTRTMAGSTPPLVAMYVRGGHVFQTKSPRGIERMALAAGLPRGQPVRGSYKIAARP
jgi:hypothetical protein